MYQNAGAVSSLLHDVGTAVGEAVRDAAASVGSDLPAGAVAAADVASDLFDRAMDSLGEAFAELGDAFSGIGGAIMDGLQAAAAGIADFADSLGDAVQDFLDGLLGAGDAEAAEPGQDGAPRPLNQGQPLSPLVLDRDGDGVELTGQAPGTTAYFDLDGDGFAERTGWVEADDGLLALDRDGNGRIDDISELFGTNDPSSNGFVPLAALDTNANGRIDA